jgi:hypothetical protein
MRNESDRTIKDHPEQRGLNTKRPTVVSFWVPRNLSHHMIRQARTGDTVLVKNRETTGRNSVSEEHRDDRKVQCL